MKQTLLEIVQDILASMDSSEVNSLTDNSEAEQVARLVRQTYFNIAPRANLDEHYELFELTASSSATPTVMYLPDSVASVDWIKYDYLETDETTPRFQKIFYSDLNEFIERMYSLDTSVTEIESCTLTLSNASVPLLYYNDRMPTVYTSYDDKTLIFDAYMSTEDTNLQGNKTLCYGRLWNNFSLTDDFIPDLDDEQFPLLFNEAKALCFAELKQVPNIKAERESSRQWVQASLKKRRAVKIPEIDRLPNYARRTR